MNKIGASVILTNPAAPVMPDPNGDNGESPEFRAG
jgi:hypothetical protein